MTSAYEPGEGQGHAWLGLSLESLTQPIRPHQEGTFVTGVPESQALVLLFFHICQMPWHTEFTGEAGVGRFGGLARQEINRCVAFQSSERRRPCKPGSCSCVCVCCHLQHCSQNFPPRTWQKDKSEPDDFLATVTLCHECQHCQALPGDMLGSFISSTQ